MKRSAHFLPWLAPAALVLAACGGRVVLDNRGVGGAGASGTTVATTVGTGSGGTGGASGKLDVCECLAGLGVSPPNHPSCAQCLSDASGSVCTEALLACVTDPACSEIVNCVGKCEYAPECCHYAPACIAKCMLPFDKDTAHMNYYKFTSCTCTACASVCHYKKPITCADLEDAGVGP